MLQNATPRRKSAPWPTSLMNMSCVLRLPQKMHLCRSSSSVPRPPSVLEMLQNPHFLLTFEKVHKVHNPLRLPRETRSECPKLVRKWCALCILTSTCASRHNGVHFFNISTSISGLSMVCFVHFDFDMCFAPQRRALFRHRNFHKWSDPGVFCIFWLRHVLRATTASTFLTSQLPTVVRTWGVFSFFTYTCASHHNSVHFFISHLARWLRTRRFSEPTFRPSGATNHWKNTVFRDFPTFSRTCIFLLLTLSLLWSSLFCSSLLSASAHLCFSSVHLVGSLTSRLPSIMEKKMFETTNQPAIKPCVSFWEQTFPRSLPWSSILKFVTLKTVCTAPLDQWWLSWSMSNFNWKV